MPPGANRIGASHLRKRASATLLESLSGARPIDNGLWPFRREKTLVATSIQLRGTEPAAECENGSREARCRWLGKTAHDGELSSHRRHFIQAARWGLGNAPRRRSARASARVRASRSPVLRKLGAPRSQLACYPDGMVAQPKRRWFRFRLSTVLILTAIVAAAMAAWPWVTIERTTITSNGSHGPACYGSAPVLPRFRYVGGETTRTSVSWHYAREHFNPELAYPALALAAFLAWKAAWAVVERRRIKAATYSYDAT